MSSGLRLDLTEYERNDPAKGDYLALTAAVSQGGFEGHTLFWVAKVYVESFVQQLDALDATLQGRAHLRCGWGEEVLFELLLQPEGHSGRLRANIETISDSRQPEQSRLSTSFVVLPNALTSFRLALASVVGGESTGPAALEIDLEAAV